MPKRPKDKIDISLAKSQELERRWRKVHEWYYMHGFLCAAYDLKQIRWQWKDPEILLAHLEGRS